jgi:hypothetical protein
MVPFAATFSPGFIRIASFSLSVSVFTNLKVSHKETSHSPKHPSEAIIRVIKNKKSESEVTGHIFFAY